MTALLRWWEQVVIYFMLSWATADAAAIERKIEEEEGRHRTGHGGLISN